MCICYICDKRYIIQRRLCVWVRATTTLLYKWWIASETDWLNGRALKLSTRLFLSATALLVPSFTEYLLAVAPPCACVLVCSAKRKYIFMEENRQPELNETETMTMAIVFWLYFVQCSSTDRYVGIFYPFTFCILYTPMEHIYRRTSITYIYIYNIHINKNVPFDLPQNADPLFNVLKEQDFPIW